MKRVAIAGILIIFCALGFSCTNDSKESKSDKPAKTEQASVKRDTGKPMTERTAKTKAEGTDTGNRDRQKDLAERFSKLDADGDDKISLTEWMTPAESGFNRFDKNKDGFIDADEVKGLRERNRKQVLKRDADKDGSISMEEWKQAAEQRFKRIDGNQDGLIAASEITLQK